MSISKTNCVTFGVQAGDKESDQAVKPYYMKLRRALADRCRRDYGQHLKEMAFVLRIDGSIWHWEKSGCDHLRVKRSGEATVDIFMPISVWQAGASAIQAYLYEHTLHGFKLMYEKMAQKGILLNTEALSADFEAALDDFLKG